MNSNYYFQSGVNTIHKGWNADLIWPLLLFLSIVGVIGMPISTGILALVSPCMDIFLGSLFLPCSNGEIVGGSTTFYIVAFAILEWYLMTQIICAGAYSNIPGNYYVVISLRTFLDAMLRQPKNIKIKLFYSLFSMSELEIYP